MIFAPAQKLSGINSNVDIKAKRTPSVGQVDTHANHVELFPAASRWIISCLAAVGCFHDLLIMIEESVRGWFVSTMYICSSSSISVCREERQTVVDLY